MFGGVIRYFYPDLKQEELNKFGHLAVAFFFTVGTYWMLRLMKDVVLYKLAFPVQFGWPMGYGRDMVPYAKSASPFVVIAALAIYTKLIDMFERHQLFYLVCSFFSVLFAIIGSILLMRNI